MWSSSENRYMVYLKIPTGKNAHEDTTYIHNIIHGKNSVVHKQFTMIQQVYPICGGSIEKANMW